MKPVNDLTPEELRAEAAKLLAEGFMLHEMVRARAERFEALESRLLYDEKVRLRAGEGLPVRTSRGEAILRRHDETKGRAWTNKEEIDKDAGELDPEFRPVKDERIVIEQASRLPTAVVAELKVLEAAPLPEGEDEPPVKFTEKAKYPTVAALRKAFGKDTKYVGTPPTQSRIALIFEGPGGAEVPFGIDGPL